MIKAAQVVAVSGANGYVGSIIAEAAKSEGKVIGLVRAPRGAEDIRWTFNVKDAEGLTEKLRARKVTGLVHAAWDMKSPSLSELTDTCIAGSARLFEAARSAGVQRIIFISTISAFDQACSAYGRSKLSTEKIALSVGGVVLRLGLVYGNKSGGVFGSIQNTVRRSAVVPLIGWGTVPQYLLHEETLKDVVKRALRGDFDGETQPITLADPKPWPFREVVARIAAGANRKIVMVPVPWRLVHLGIMALERLGLKLEVRSDSVLGFICHNETPDFTALRRFGIKTASFADWPSRIRKTSQR